MAAPLQPMSPADRALKQLAEERQRDADGHAAGWTFLWTLFIFKLVTVCLIIYAASGTGESFVVTIANTWYWLAIPILALSGPLVLRWRMIKLRRKRAALRASEWNVDTVVIGEPLPPDVQLGHDR